MKKLILISGLARSGKDSTADILTKLLGSDCAKVPMARDLKYIAKDYFGFKGTHSNKDREILQQLGTDIIRKKLNKPLFHVQHACDVIDIIQDKYDYIFCPDIRFENEYYYLKAKYGDKAISINTRRKGDNKDDNLTQDQHSHPSENGMNNFSNYDFIIESESGLDNLEIEIKRILPMISDRKEELEDLKLGNRVKVIKILNPNKAGHLESLIGQEGFIASWIVNGEKRYKVFFDPFEFINTTYYFKRTELELLEG